MNKDNKIKELFKNDCHLGHKKNKVHPKAKKYIYTYNNGISIIDLNKTVDLLEQAKKYILDLQKNNKKLLVVATKKILSEAIKNICQKYNLPYVNIKWPAGLLTNFETLTKNVKKLKNLRKEKEEGKWNQYVKHEQIKLEKKLKKLEKFYQGIESLEKIPDAIFIIDIKKEKNAFKEAISQKIPIIAIVDTNVDPSLINYPIPANDDSLSSVQYIVEDLFSSINNK